VEVTFDVACLTRPLFMKKRGHASIRNIHENLRRIIESNKSS